MEKTNHKITIESRCETEITGVIDMGAYNDEEIEIETSCGMLIINGSGFNVTKLDVETGILKISGKIESLYYSEKTTNSSGNVFSRIFKQ